MKRFLSKVSAHVVVSLLAGAIPYGMLLAALPAFAGDPFRTQNPKPIGADTQSAFELMFKQGDYIAASKQLTKALRSEYEDPLAQGMRASMAYIEKDLESMKIYTNKTRVAAQKLLGTDKLRGHLYMGVSYLLEAGYIVTSQGVVSGAPSALGLVDKLLKEIDEAQDINPNDPELNLIKGYMDMLMASVFPSDLEKALSSLRNAGPDYLKYRGIALGYRDAKKPAEALDAIDKALAAAPNNPELQYLKGQILWMKGCSGIDAAKIEYRKALDKSKQLPSELVKQINGEYSSLNNSKCS
jgi:tetratricopeptide (TPR) repeat protein